MHEYQWRRKLILWAGAPSLWPLIWHCALIEMWKVLALKWNSAGVSWSRVMVVVLLLGNFMGAPAPGAPVLPTPLNTPIARKIIVYYIHTKLVFLFSPHRQLRKLSRSSLGRMACPPGGGTASHRGTGHNGDSKSDPSASRCLQLECTLSTVSTRVGKCMY